MSLITGKFFAFLCILFILYYLIPKKFQWILLLIGSIYFYSCSSPLLLLFLLASSVSTYLLGLISGSANLSHAKKKFSMICCIIFNAGILIILKYTGFVFEIIRSVTKVNLSSPSFLLPLGISFYTFMVISYIADVYKGEVEAERNYFKFLLYVSWFPQIIEGPINRYKLIKDEMFSAHSLDIQRCKEGGYRILQGLFKKVVIAGRFSVYVDRVYASPASYDGLTLLLATVFYVIQLYTDFSGCMDMVIGISELFGIKMSENFNLPLFSKDVSEFWRRWHITLGTWFKDYIYYPVFRSKFSNRLKETFKNTPLKKKATTISASFALFCVWSLTGIWHGAAMHYLVWGLYYAVILIIVQFLANDFKKLNKNHPEIFKTKWFDIFRIIRTLFIVTFGELIFRAESLKDAGIIISGIVTKFSLSGSAIAASILPFTEDNTAVGYSIVAILSFICLYITEIFAYNGKDTFKKHKYINAAILIVVTLLFGVFGESGFLYMAY